MSRHWLGCGTLPSVFSRSVRGTSVIVIGRLSNVYDECCHSYGLEFGSGLIACCLSWQRLWSAWEGRQVGLDLSGSEAIWDCHAFDIGDMAKSWQSDGYCLSWDM